MRHQQQSCDTLLAQQNEVLLWLSAKANKGKKVSCLHYCARRLLQIELLSCSITLHPAALYTQACAVIMWSNSPATAPVAPELQPAAHFQHSSRLQAAQEAYSKNHAYSHIGACCLLARWGWQRRHCPALTVSLMVSNSKRPTGRHAPALLQG